MHSPRTFSAGGVVLNAAGQVLIVSQRGKSWSLPKGHVEEGEELLNAARREIHEESGLTELEFVRELGTYERFRIGKDGGENREELKVITLFLFRTRQDTLAPIDPDNPEARWVNKDQVTTFLTHDKDKSYFQSLLDDILI